MHTYRLTTGAPLRAMAIAAVATLSGAIIIVLAGIFDWPTAVGVVGGGLAALGIVVGALAWIFRILLTVVVEIDDDGFRMLRGSREQQGGRWTDISRLGSSDQGGLLRLVRRTGEPDTVIISPAGRRSRELDRLAADIVTRLQQH